MACGNSVQVVAIFPQGTGKNWLNNRNMSGMDITAKIKLEKTNWLDIDLLPPARSVIIGVPVIGGTALSKMNRRAML